MAKQINLRINGQEFYANISKIDRNKLYGRTEVVMTNAKDGSVCHTSNLNYDDCKTIIPKGSMTFAKVSEDGLWMDSTMFKKVNEDGSDAVIYDSTLDKPIVISQKSDEEELLDHNIISVYEISGNSTDLLADIIGDNIYTFKFNYCKSAEQNDAFLISKNKSLFILVGEKLMFDFIGINEEAIIQDEEDEEEIEDELDFGFGMMQSAC